MLIVNFSIGVDRKDADEVQDKIMDLGIEISKRYPSEEKGLSGETMVPRVIFDCYGPIARFEMLKKYLENDNNVTAILDF